MMTDIDDPLHSSDDETYKPNKQQKKNLKTNPKKPRKERVLKRRMPLFLDKPLFLHDAPDLLINTGAPNGETPKKNLKRRQLYLHCYEAKYTATEAARYLNSVYGENFATKTSIAGWYRKFRSKDYSLCDKVSFEELLDDSTEYDSI